jgi:autotransporter-associated beta strand protein
VSGSGSLVQSGSGTAIVSGANSFTGGVLIKAGVFQVGSASAAGGTPTAASVAFGPAAAAGATFRLSGYNVTLTNLSTDPLTPGGATVENGGTAAAALTVSNADGNSLFLGMLQDGGTAALALNKTGSGNLTLGGFNTFSGATNVSNGGVLTLTNSAALQNSSLSLQSGTTLNLRGNNSESFATPGVNFNDFLGSIAMDVGALTAGHTGNTLAIPLLHFNHSTTLALTDASNDGYSLSFGSVDLNNAQNTFNNSAPLNITAMQGSSTNRNNTQKFIGSGPVTIGSFNDEPGHAQSESLEVNNAMGLVTLAGTSTYSGGTYVLNGTLVVDNSYGIQDGSNLYIGSGVGAFGDVIPASTVPASTAAAVVVPEPGTLALLLAGAALAGFGVWRKRR